jgi:hypothetical protein
MAASPRGRGRSGPARRAACSSSACCAGNFPCLYVRGPTQPIAPYHAITVTTALKSAYRNTAFLSTRTTAELRELLTPGSGNDRSPDCSAASSAVAGLRRVLSRKGSRVSRSDDRRIASVAICITSCKRAVFLLCQRVLAPGAAVNRLTRSPAAKVGSGWGGRATRRWSSCW